MTISSDHPLFGAATIPLSSNKIPLVKGWTDSNNIPQETIDNWWSRCPSNYIGIICGPTGHGPEICVVDLDIDKSLNAKTGEILWNNLQLEFGQVKEGLIQTTPSGGKHIFFKHSDKVKISTGSLPSLDVRAISKRGNPGGLVVVAPTEGYVMSGSGLPEAPKWLSLLSTLLPGKTVANEISDLIATAAHLTEGGRNDFIYSVCGIQLAARGVRDGMEAILRTINDHMLEPLSESELTTAIQSVKGSQIFNDVETEETKDELAKLNEDWCIIPMNGKTRVVNTGPDPVTGRASLSFYAKQDFIDLHANRFILLNDKQIDLGTAWFKSPNRMQKGGLSFDPGYTTNPEQVLNLWRGWALEPRQGDWSLLHAHIKNQICYGDNEAYLHMMGNMAHMIQYPGGPKPGVAVLIRGARGSGKGIMFRHLGALINPMHYVHAATEAHFTGKFNSHLESCLMIFLDEAVWGGNKKSESSLKALITEDQMIVEHKGIPARPGVPNHMRVFMASNEKWAVPAGIGERRFLVLDMNNNKCGDISYFQAIDNQMRNGGREAMLYDLMRWDCEQVELRKPPVTKGLIEQQVINLEPTQEYWLTILSEGYKFELNNGHFTSKDDEFHQDKSALVSRQLVYEHFRENISDKGRIPSPATFWTTTYEVFGDLKSIRIRENNQRVYSTEFPPYPELVKLFSKNVVKIRGLDYIQDDSQSAPEQYPVPDDCEI